MIKILDRFIIKKYVTTFFFTAFLFTLIIMVIDTSEKIEKFITEKASLKEIFFHYYAGAVPYFNWLLWPLFSLISVIFFTSRMAANSEVISILNAGVSYWRFLRPYLMAGIFISSLHLMGNHFLIPILNKNKINFEATYIRKNNNKDLNSNIHFMLTNHSKIFFKSYSRLDSTGRGIRIETFENDQLINLFKAREGKFDNKTGQWIFSDITEHTFDGLKESLKVYKTEKISKQLNIGPEDFYSLYNFDQMMTTPALINYIKKEKARGVGNMTDYEIEVHRRTADSFTIIILTIMGVSVASRKVRGGMGMHLVFGVSMGALYIILSRFSATFAQNSFIPVVLGVWIPNILFICVSIFLFSRAQK